MDELLDKLGDDALLSDLAADQTAAAFTAAWENTAARTWNRHRSGSRSAQPGRSCSIARRPRW
ncbi:hypothetical protein [Nonomuraea sp. NPDC003754]